MRHLRLVLVLVPWLAACAAAPAPELRHALSGPPPAFEYPEAAREYADPARDLRDLELSSSVSLEALGQTYGQSPNLSAGPGRPHRQYWQPGIPLLQGYLGATQLETLERTGGSTPPVDGSDESSSQFPTIGGGAQWKIAGNHIDFGFEGLLGFGGRANGGAFVVGGGGAAVAVNIDLLLFELYGGPFVSVFLGERLRAYLAAGPVMQWASYDQDGPQSSSGTGFGTGVYARTGLELRTSPGTLVGLGVRWLDTTIDLDSGLGDLDVEGFQFVLTVTRSN